MRIPIRRASRTQTPPPADMTLVGHLTELRSRLIKSVLAIVIGAILVYVFNGPIFDVMQAPYCQLKEEAAQPCEFLIQSPLESFSVVLSISGYGGLIVAMPVILYQIARFVLPGLYPQERKVLTPFVVVSVVLLLIGIVSGYLLLPKTLSVLSSFGSDNFVEMFSPKDYVSFLVKMLLAFGIAAELPLVLVFLQLIGIVNTATLRKSRRLAVVIVVILAAIITPTGDPFTLGVLSVPMYLSYEIALIVGWRLTRHRRAAALG